MTRQGVVLLGRQDTPTDAVQDYCQYLADALCTHDFQLALERVNWSENGWSAALRELRSKALGWRAQWVFVQYTALAWSSRGFPQRFLRILRVLRHAHARVAVVYHDPAAYAGTRWIDKIRRTVQLITMRRALSGCDLAIVTVCPQNLDWLPANHDRVVFIPVGVNLPPAAIRNENRPLHNPPTIAVYGITGGESGRQEMRVITQAVKFAAQKLGPLRLNAFGRNADTQERALREAFRDSPVQVQVSGVLGSVEVARQFYSSDVHLFIRGTISSGRGSVIAGIACGLPVIACAGPHTAEPITDAGVIFVSPENPQEAGEALVRVLSDSSYQDSLAARSRAVYEHHLSWTAIAARYAKALEATEQKSPEKTQS